MSKEQTLSELAKSLAEAGLAPDQITQILTAKAGGGLGSAINTKESMAKPQVDITKILRNARNKFKHEKLAPVSVAVPYGSQIGGYLKVGINGTTIEIPADGNTYHVPKSFAAEVKRRLHNLDVMFSAKGPSLGETELSPWASQGQLKAGDVKIDEVSYK